MPLRRFALGETGTEASNGKALKLLENLLGRTPIFGAHRTVTTASTFLDSDWLIKADTTAGSVVLTLPEAAKNTGREFVALKTIAANTLTVEGFGSETINDAANLAWTTRYAARTFYSDGVQYWVVAAYL